MPAPTTLTGIGAWWTAPELKLAFLRPIAAATQAVDFGLRPDNPFLMHLHTLLWYLAFLLAVQALYRRLLPLAAANCALALYAWDDARGQVLSWVANRHALLAGLFGALSLVAYDKYWRDAWVPGSWLGPALLALALLSGEMGLAITPILLGYALFVDKGALRLRLLRLAPYGFVVVYSHDFKLDKALQGTQGGTLSNFTRVETFGAGDTHWVSATVDPNNPNLFVFEPRIVPENAE